jgi:methylmalonyl-CoA/ethylmalonyl-CoA epimerase
MKLDHVGYVVSDMTESLQRFCAVYGFHQVTDITYDPLQHVNLVMLEQESLQRVELIQPIDENSASFSFMKSGGGLHHFCFKVDDLEKAIADLKEQKFLLFVKPVPAILFNHKRVCFLFSKRDRSIIELVES